MKWNEIEPKALEIKNSLLENMDAMIKYQREWQLPPLDPFFFASRQGVEKNDFNVVICGEVKHGKSTFLNAVIGKPILPTGVAETTCQVFYISHSDVESFYLVFEDGQKKKIDASELIRFGSQTEIDMRGEPLLAGKILKWIEINTPLAFLPQGVHLLDTPGLGAMYARHGEITKRIVKESDAVVFVTDSSRELTTPQINFLYEIFAITEEVLFVQTKIDEVDETAWKTVQKKSESLLAKHFGSKERLLAIHPINSMMLLEAGAETDANMRNMQVDYSLFKPLRGILEYMIFKTAGWRYSGVALNAMNAYCATGLRWLNEQIGMVAAKTKEERERILADKRQLGIDFERRWGINGAERASANRILSEILDDVATSGRKICASGGEISRYAALITEADTFDEIKSLNDGLLDAVYSEACQEWSYVVNRAQQKFSEQLSHLNMSVQPVNIPPLNITVQNLRKSDFMKKVQSTALRSTVGGAAGTVAGGVVGGAIGTVLSFLTFGVAAPLIPTLIAAGSAIGGGGGTILGAKSGWKEVTQMDIGSARNTALSNLERCRAKVNYELSTSSAIRDFCRNAKAEFNEAMTKEVERQQAQVEAEREHLDRQSKMNEEHLAAESNRLQMQRNTWNEIGKAIKTNDERLGQLVNALK